MKWSSTLGQFIHCWMKTTNSPLFSHGDFNHFSIKLCVTAIDFSIFSWFHIHRLENTPILRLFGRLLLIMWSDLQTVSMLNLSLIRLPCFIFFLDLRFGQCMYRAVLYLNVVCVKGNGFMCHRTDVQYLGFNILIFRPHFLLSLQRSLIFASLMMCDIRMMWSAQR